MNPGSRCMMRRIGARESVFGARGRFHSHNGRCGVQVYVAAGGLTVLGKRLP